jgi:hypothetical protein
MTPQLQDLISAARRYSASPPTGPVAAARARLARSLVICVRAAAVKELASNIGSPLEDQLTSRADITITNLIDDYCGTTVPLVPRPWPGPSPAALELATLLTIFANTYLQPGQLRTEVISIASRLAKKAYEEGGLSA